MRARTSRASKPPAPRKAKRVAATTLTAERSLPYAPADLCKLVGDVRAYPSFIPWVKSLRVTEEVQEGEAWFGIAELLVGWRAFLERFSTKVRCDPVKGEVDVSLVNGPLRTLENRWRFYSAPGGALIKFTIQYDFKNPVLNALVSANRALITNRVLAAFEGEAARRFGAR